MFDLWWLGGDDEAEEKVFAYHVADVGSIREALAAGQQHATAHPGLGGCYRLCDAAGEVLGQFTARELGAVALVAQPL